MLTIQISLLIAHFVGDFLLQSDYMALNKSKSNSVLAYHCAVYTIPFTFLGWGVLPILALFLSHFVTDYFTSRATSKLWFIDLEPLVTPTGPPVFTHYARLLPSRHWFFVMIGFDQLIHFATLALIWRLL